MQPMDDDSKYQPVIPDSTLGSDTSGLQQLANRIAEQRAAQQPQAASPITINVHMGPQDSDPTSLPDIQPQVAHDLNFADGGVVPDSESGGDFLNQLNAGTVPGMATQAPPAVPPMSDVMTAINQAPSTDPSIYQGMTAEDRAALQQQLMAKQNSGAGLVAQGVAGLGDAISNSFGGKNTSFQKDMMANNELQQKKQVDAMDTERTQKAQDYQMAIAQQENDPNSSLSQQGRALFQQMGIPVPSGMGFTQLKALSPQVADLVKGKWEQQNHQDMLAQTRAYQAEEEKNREAQLKQTAAYQTAEAGVQAAEQKTREQEQATRDEDERYKELEETSKHWLLDPAAAIRADKQLAQNAGVGNPNDAPAFDVGKAVKTASGAIITRIK